MELNVSLTKKGYTLIEMLIAIAILAVVSVALMQSSLYVLQNNIRNELRDEAVRLVDQQLNEIRSGPGGFDNQNPNGSGIDLYLASNTLFVDLDLPDVARTIRGVTTTYHVHKRLDQLDANSKQVTVTVTWMFRNVAQGPHAVTSIVRRFGT